MITFENLNLVQLRKLVKDYDLHYHIPKYSKMKKDELISEMKKHLKIEGDMIKTVMTPFEQKAPYSTKEKKGFSKAYDEILKNPMIRNMTPAETLEFYYKNKMPKTKKKLEKEQKEAEKMKALFESNIKKEDLEGSGESHSDLAKAVMKKEASKSMLSKIDNRLKEIESESASLPEHRGAFKNPKRAKLEKEVGMLEGNQQILDERYKRYNKIVKKLAGYGKGKYALHAVLINKSLGYDLAFKEAQDIIKKKKFFHRETTNQYRFRNIPKQKFEPKTFRSHKVNKDITLVFGQLKPDYEHLEGGGIFSWLKDKVSAGVQKVKEFIKPRLDDYNNSSRRTIDQYGQMPIKQLFIMRTPIQSILNTVINYISLGKWNELKQKYGFDKLFHLSLVAKLDNGKHIIMEKNEVVNVSPEFSFGKDSETFDIPFNGQLTISQMLETARKNVGDNLFFSYDPFKNNCQYFIRYLLEGQGLYSEGAKNFLFQDLESIYKELPEYVPKVMKGTTTIGAIVNKILGKGKHKIIMNPEDFIKEHKKLIGLLRQFDDPKLRAEADEQAKELKAETGVDLTGKGKKKKIYY